MKMKITKKICKIESLLTLSYYEVSNEKLIAISKDWSIKALDYLIEMWHKYYNSKAHELISYIIVMFKEKDINLNALENLFEESGFKSPLINSK